MTKKLKVLAVEDSLSTQAILKSIMSFHDLDVSIASSSKEARRLFDLNDYSLIILDVYLEDGKSKLFMEYVNKTNSRLPVIVMTSDIDEKVICEFYELGAKDFLHKPVNVYLLSRKIKNILDGYLLELENHNKTVLLEKMMHEKEQEENLAFYVHDHIIQKNVIDIYGVEYSSLSHGKFCGDVLLSIVKPNGNLLVMLADATGHGMAAAITIYPLVSTFSALAKKGFPTATILQDLNEKHTQTIPHNRFIACIMIEVLYHENEIIIWNAGMPDVLLFDFENRPMARIKSKNMALGVFPKEQMSIKFDRFSLDDVGMACLMSDGVIENKVFSDKMLSFNEIYQDIEENELDSVDIISKYSALSATNEVVDDMSVCFIDFIKVKDHLKNFSENHAIPTEKGDIIFSFLISGKSISNENIVYDLIKALEGYSFNIEFVQKVFLVMTELVTNAIDHGVLNISSKLKENNFVDYLNSRSNGMKSLSEKDFVSIGLNWNAKQRHLVVTVQDSGQGYNVEASGSSSDKGLHGRGLILVEKICKSFSYDKKENKTTVVIAK